uniref:Uncharacterized protein n=1 Tax=uncultured prokaryote TaxID=198431 RepID=A0A0H5Q1C5_9ZZZZ|nr:hypothetical protein [uncultured prokaryote]
MSLVIPPGYGQANFIFTSNEGTEPFVTTLGLNLGDAEGDFVAAANQAFAVWALDLLPLMDSDLVLDRVQLFIGADGPSGSVDSTLPPDNGNRTSEGLPWSLSTIARKNTTDLGRAGRGRMFIPGMVSPGEIGQGGNINNTRRTAIQTGLQAFYDDLVAGDAGGPALPPVLFHNPGTATSPTAITGFTVAPLVGWIRKRIR